MPEKIRVGLSRCDTHGAYFAALMARHDPLLLRDPTSLAKEPAHYTWQTGGAYFYFYTHYAGPKRIMVDTVDGFEIVKVWDEHRDAAEVLAKVFLGRAEVCDHFEQVSDGVDLVFIADCNYDGSDHLALAEPGLRKGVPTYVDKPMAYTSADVQAMLELSIKHAAPLYSMSILGALPAAARFSARLPEVGQLQFGTVQGGGTAAAGIIHAVMLALHVFGQGVDTVCCSGADSHEVIQLVWAEQPDRPPRGVNISTNIGTVPHAAFYVSAYGSEGAIHSPALGDFEFPYGAAAILRSVKQMVQTRRMPETLAMMVEGIAVAEAARLSKGTGRAVRVADVIGGEASAGGRSGD